MSFAADIVEPSVTGVTLVLVTAINATVGIVLAVINKRQKRVEANTKVVRHELEPNGSGTTTDRIHHMTDMLHAMNRRMGKFEGIMLRRMRRVERHLGIDDEDTDG